MDYLILGLATWRLSSLFVNEQGPFAVLDKLREITGAFECIWCLSVWIGIALTISYLAIPAYTTWLCLPFALSAIAICVDKWTG